MHYKLGNGVSEIVNVHDNFTSLRIYTMPFFSTKSITRIYLIYGTLQNYHLTITNLF